MELVLPMDFLVRYSDEVAKANVTPVTTIIYEELEPSIRWSSLLLISFIALGTAGNALVCIAISTDRRLQNVTNYFLFSLAVADLLVSLIVMPFSILNELYDGRWQYSFALCAGYTYADVFLCSASIVHMSIISLDRYLGISRPLKTRNKSKLVVILKIVTVWIITTMISCPIAVLALVNAEDIYYDQVCSIRNRYFLIYGSTLSFLIPCVIMLATFVRTTQLLRQQAILCSSSASLTDRISQNGVPIVSLRRSRTRQRPSKLGARGSADSRSGLSRRNSPSFMSNNDSGSRRSIGNKSAIDSPMELHSTDHLQIVLPAKKTGRSSYCSSDEHTDHNQSQRYSLKETYLEKTLSKKFRERTITLWHKTRHKAGAASDLANEQKATRVLGLVFGCFVVCWTPFFVQNFTLAFCGGQCNVPPWLASIFLWLGYLSSTINPIIYTIFNKRFRQAFANILRCRCGRSNSDGRLGRASASSYHSVNNHGINNSNGLVSPVSPYGITGSTKCSITRLPVDQIEGMC